jgi:hypothetical protein
MTEYAKNCFKKLRLDGTKNVWISEGIVQDGGIFSGGKPRMILNG